MDYSYKIKCLGMLKNKESITLNNEVPIIDLSKNVAELFKSNNYEMNVFPSMQLTLLIDTPTMSMIQLDNDFVFEITIDEVISENDLVSEEVTLRTNNLIKNEKFNIIDKDTSVITDYKSIEENAETDPYTIGNYQFITFTIMATNDLNNNKKIISDVLNKTDMNGTLLYLASKLNKERPLLLQEPDNNKIFNQVILPPNNVIRTIKYINTIYGLYNTGLRLFFDIHCSFITSKLNTKDLPTLPNTFKKTYVNVTDVSNTVINNSSSEDEGKYYNISTTLESLNFINYNDSKSEYMGSTAIILSNNGKTVKREYETGGNIEKTRVFKGLYNNKYRETELISNGLNGSFIQIPLSNHSIFSIDPDKEFEVRFYLGEDTTTPNNFYSGKYILLKSETSFKSINGSASEFLSIESVITVLKQSTISKKIKETEK